MFLENLGKPVREGSLRAVLFSMAALFLTARLVSAQQAQPPVDATKARIGQLEEEVQALKALLQQQAAPAQPATTDPAAVTKIVDQWFKEREAKEEEKKKAEAEKKKNLGFLVGDDLKL